MARILVTGCSSGIGRATASLLAERGHEVIATARDVATLADLPVAERMALDVTDHRAVDDVVRRAGAIDVLVNNAGLAMWGPIELSGIEDIERLFDTNVHGVLRMTRAVLPGMRERGRGRIVQISSGAARRPQPLVGIYCATKAALEALSLALRIEMRSFGVDVAVVGMGAIDSSIDHNRIVSDARESPYAAMMAGMLSRTGELRAQAYSSTEAAGVIASVVEAGKTPFRTYVGEGFARALGKMAALDDDAYEEKLFATLHASRGD